MPKTWKHMLAAAIAATTTSCAPDIPMEYSMQCLRLVQDTPEGSEIHDTRRPRWAADHEDGRGPIHFDFSHLTGEREVEYDYIAYYIDVGDVSVPIYATDTRIVGYGPRFRATCSLQGDQVVLDGVVGRGEWEGGL